MWAERGKRGEGEGQEPPTLPPDRAQRGSVRAWGRWSEAGLQDRGQGAKGRGWEGRGGDPWTLSEASPWWGFLVLKPGETSCLGPHATHPAPHSYTSSTRALSLNTQPCSLGRSRAPGLAPGQGKWGPQLTSSEGSGMSDAPCAPA